MGKKHEKLYNTLKETGELSIMFPDLKGNWEKDKKVFIREHDKLESYTSDIEIDDYDKY